MSCFFGPGACEILAPWPGIEPAPPALEGELLTTGLPGKSLKDIFLTLAGVLGPRAQIIQGRKWCAQESRE